MTAFMLFSNATRAQVKEENPDISFGELVSSPRSMMDIVLFHTAYKLFMLLCYSGEENGRAFQGTHGR